MRKYGPIIGFFGLVGLLLVLLAVRCNAPTVVRVNSVNPELQKGILEAKAGLPAFWLMVLHAPEAQQKDFAVRVQFKTPQGPEYLWVRGRLSRKTNVSGTLDQNPLAYRGARKGDLVTFPESDIVDWLVKMPDGSLVGGFTEQALSRK